MTWWFWIVAGLGLLALEIVATSSLFLLFPGISAILVGLAASLFEGFAPWAQWTVFTILSFSLTGLFRARVLSRLSSHQDADLERIVGQHAQASATFEPSMHGTVEFQGTVWSAKNVGSLPIQAGERCRIERIDGLSLEVSSERAVPKP